ncbi:MAG: hypothetical protein K8R92_03485 [Planctomycetes bacterium]|nr:hypothetical protein [Planctomycetota bacterium]
MNAEVKQLPFEIQRLIAKVVRRTRLRKGERADIERELAAHFRDGLDSGKSVAQLIAAFGVAKASAKSVRAGAIAKRPPFDRALRQLRIAGGWSFVACILLYAGSIWYLWLQSPVITFDALERYLATFPMVAEQDRGWPIYKQGLIALADPIMDTPDPTRTDWRLPGSSLTFESLGIEQGNAIPNQASWTLQCKVMRERRAGIDAIVRAASMPALGYVPSTQPKLEDADIYGNYHSSFMRASHYFGFDIELPNAWTLCGAARFLGTDSLMSIEEGDGARFIRDINSMIRISHHAEEGMLVGSQHWGTSIRDFAFTRIIMAMEWRPDALSDDQLRQLADLLGSIPASDFELDLTTEPIAVQDFLQRAYSDNGSGDGVFNPVYGSSLVRLLVMRSTPGSVVNYDDSGISMDRSVLAPTGAFANASRKEVNELYDAMIRKAAEQAKRPLWQQDFSFEQGLIGRSMRTVLGDNELAQSKWAIPRMLIPAFSWSATARRLGESQCAAAQTAIALTQYRRAHGGAWPVRLDELVPTYLSAVPFDPWTGKSINYEVREGHPYVWSVGEFQKAVNGESEEHFPGWRNVAYKGPLYELYWLWFRGDDKLERWKPKE